jgi:hypothetical protein
MISNYIIECIKLEDVKEFDKIKYNTNNHWTNDQKPNDYEHVLSLGNTKNWIDKFHTDYKVIDIDPTELKWMKKAAVIGAMTARFSNMYIDELNDMLVKYTHTNDLFKNEGYFVRCESVSLKYGCHRVGPYHDLKSICESLVSSTCGHSPVNDKTESVRLYLLKWLTFDKNKEFRVFVHKNKITAISQQNLYKENEFLKNIPLDERNSVITKWITIINNYFTNIIRTKIDFVDSYVMDICILETDEPYFIEINCFGKEYAAGSSLFHWLMDEEILYGKKDKIYFRYVLN